ncbi:MAG: hypothetical protein AVDCRST_MAG47-594 [uncultured Nocardioidaceae bacterium]|uniref:Uncharacterized protein n=1 Tax=uncultured Nocardioidaceae bacterium TaxID=253824 RepID=A0A6J4MQI2_9ACTN|nr:MAG: hypothetical protein AVDCRST_MAG47-594 [uncultured Nocardioidaceae bacterium]
MRVDVEDLTRLEFDDGAPVRAASAIARLGPGWLVAQDDATHAAWWHGDSVRPVRIFPAIEGHDVFEESSGNKHLKPDLEAACEVLVADQESVLMLGSGSSEARMRGALTSWSSGEPEVTLADLTPLYAAVAGALSITADELNLEGACVIGEMVRWFHRGMPSAGLPTGSIDLDLEALVAAIRGELDPAEVVPGNALHYDLGEVGGVGLAATDAVVLSGSTSSPVLLLSAAAEDAPNPRDDGPVVGSALVVLEGSRVVASAALPDVDGCVNKVEGLALVERSSRSARVLATVDADDHAAPSLALHLRLDW